jgi:hypothetical protein
MYTKFDKYKSGANSSKIYIWGTDENLSLLEVAEILTLTWMQDNGLLHGFQPHLVLLPPNMAYTF